MLSRQLTEQPPATAEPMRGGPPQRTASTSGRPFSIRGFASLTIVVCFLLLVASGTVLYIAPRGRVANWTAWTMGGLSREQWSALHLNISCLFLVIAALHLAMNWSRFAGYLKRHARPGIYMKKELAAALAVAAAIFVGSTGNLPPFSIVTGFKYLMRDYWEQRVDARETTPTTPTTPVAEFARIQL